MRNVSQHPKKEKEHSKKCLLKSVIKISSSSFLRTPNVTYYCETCFFPRKLHVSFNICCETFVIRWEYTVDWWPVHQRKTANVLRGFKSPEVLKLGKVRKQKENQVAWRPPGHSSQSSPLIPILKLIYCMFRWTVTPDSDKGRGHTRDISSSVWIKQKPLTLQSPAFSGLSALHLKSGRQIDVCVCVCGSGEVKVCACVGLCWGPAVEDMLLRGKCLDFVGGLFSPLTFPAYSLSSCFKTTLLTQLLMTTHTMTFHPDIEHKIYTRITVQIVQILYFPMSTL